MKKILLIAYYFPPALISESIRSMRTVKYLPQFDFDPVILTTNMIEGKVDQSLLQELPHAGWPAAVTMFRLARSLFQQGRTITHGTRHS